MRVYIVAASDAEPDEERRLRWGDYWFKDSLGKALHGLAHEVTTDLLQAEALINLHGAVVQWLPEWTYNVLWIIGHPDTVTKEECWQYDAVFCESERFTDHLREQGIETVHLPGASDFVPMDVPRAHNMVFVGNARDGTRPCIDELGDLDRWVDMLEVWGEGWEHLPEGIWQGTYYPHEKLNELYASSTAILGDSHEDMQRWAFRNPREYDILAAGGDKVPTFAECAERIIERVPRERTMIELGCGDRPRPGFIGVDKQMSLERNIMGMDLEHGLPDNFGTVDVIVAENLLEHINNLIPLMNDCHDALLPTGRMHIRVPAATSTAAFQDPTHVRYFVPETFDYFDVAHGRWQVYGRSYGIKPWRLVTRRMDGVMIDVMMRPAEEATA